MLIHTVTKSDTLEGIAARYRISEAKLVEDNGLIPPYGIIEGQTLCIPHPSLFHTVYGGETEEGIALCYQTDIDTLKQLNFYLNIEIVLLRGFYISLINTKAVQILSILITIIYTNR